MQRYKIKIEYDGTPFVGWQFQKNGPSIQEVLQKAIFNFSKEKVVIIDDLIATGGTAGAAAKLVEKSGGEVSGFIFVINLFDLGGKKLLEKKGYKSFSLINFPGH